jgi:AbiV family abortive infection protein
MRACYRNAKEYVSLSRLAHERRMYGKAYAMAVLGLEQVGATIFWLWMASDSWRSLPLELRAHLEGDGKGKSVISDHVKKQATLGFTVVLLFYLIGHSAEAKLSKHAPIPVFARRAARRVGALQREFAPDFQRMQERKFRGLYVDPEARRLRAPWEIKARDSTRIIELLVWLVHLLRGDVRFPSTPLRSKRLKNAGDQTMRDIEEYLARTPNPTVGNVQAFAGKAWERRFRESFRRRRAGMPRAGLAEEE